MRADTLIVLPTYNEVENLGAIVPAIRAALPEADLLIVDDLSPDGTGALADRLARRDPSVSVLHREGPRGLGPAYLAGFRLALSRGYARVVEMDADFSHQPHYLPALIEASANADLALGSRYVPGGGIRGWGPHRLALSRFGNLYARAVLGVPVRDLTGGFKCFRREVLEAIPLDRVRTQGYGFQIELTWRALQRGFRVVEVPIVFPDREVGASKMSLAICGEALTGVWRMRLEGRQEP
ncbi:MAG: polyprenol monophosphomannose synthase [Alphaproteobacteria bacterium]|nr:polyprenol monophosphomannose synthase [Alphaproteobacteria bacterium]MCB9792331.1 polyprenol monophosphomannose synthase [Alphaproteobacteria bacterium]